MVGASFTGFTVRRKLVLVLLVPSLTVSVIVVVPKALVTGVIVTVRFAPLPPNTMLFVGTSAGFDEPPLTVSEVAGVSKSPTVKPSAGVEVSSLTIWSATPVTVGASFTGLTVSTKFVLVLFVTSFTIKVIVAVP